ncbi:hypothetical protein ACT16_19310 [Mycobacterium heckeshornense]|nr:hypothetical protein ACT16_19310 [Mycobacterium heckeshornense]
MASAVSFGERVACAVEQTPAAAPCWWDHLLMDDQEDPEKRIAELERQLAEQTRAAELGSQQISVSRSDETPRTPPVAPTPASPTPDSSAGFPRWRRSGPLPRWRLVWILVAFWVVMIAVGNGVSRIFTHVSHYSSPPSSSTMLPLTGGPSASSVAPQPFPSELTVGRGGVLSLGGNGRSQTVSCNDGTLNLSGNNNTFTVTGHCLRLQVSGNYTHVTIDSADTIDAGGIYTVTIYHSGTPTINKSGIDVTVSQG